MSQMACPIPRQRAQSPPALPHLALQLSDFADTAAALSQPGLVLMTDSAVAHLAGALGKPRLGAA